MKTLSTLFVVAATLLCSQPADLGAAEPSVAIVDFKQCAEDSKLGKQQQENFEGLKQQIQDVMDEKEKEIKELTEKFQDPDFLDSLSPEAEAKLKEDYQRKSYEHNQMQQQFYQTLQQANMQIVRLIGETVQEHAKLIAKEKNIDLVLNAEGLFYFNAPFDLTNDVVAAMNVAFDKAAKEAKESAE